MRSLLGLFALLLLMLGAAPADAQLPPPGRNAIAASLIAETDTPAPGSTITLAIAMKPDAGWHGYWKNPGDSGVETQIAWNLPAGLSAGQLLYPVPKTLIVAGLMNYVYEGDHALLADLKIPAGLAPGTRLPITAKIDYLACTDEVCVPQKADLATELTVGQPGAGPARQTQFDAWRAALPRPLGSPAAFANANGTFRLAIPVPAAMALDTPYVFPLTDGALDYAAPQAISRNGDMLIVEVKGGPGIAALQTMDGVLKIGARQGLAFSAKPGAVPAAGDPLGEASATSGSASTIILALFGALVGGLILNIMPCVFPILSLKALSLAKAGGDETEARREALAYTAGAILTCLALGGVLLSLRASGAAAGWAFQLQDPRVILTLLVLVTAIALNLAGLFELPNLGFGSRLAGAGGTSGSFWTGALAAFVATPCTGPFMGAALGAALVLPAAAALAIFAGLGLGLALPFLLLGFVPALRRRLPKPGPWMDRFRRILSLPMFATALALVWILGRQAGVDGMALGLGAALVVGLCLWWMGRRSSAAIPLILAAGTALAAIAVIPTAPPASATTPSEAALAAEPFTEARLAALQSENKPVFVYFTADWCITCKVNEKASLQRGEVADAFRQKGVTVLVGDWTRGDAAIGRFLAQHGRSGVPLYLWYAPGKPARVLPQILTPGMLTDLTP